MGGNMCFILGPETRLTFVCPMSFLGCASLLYRVQISDDSGSGSRSDTSFLEVWCLVRELTQVIGWFGIRFEN